jgi:hypothetical protein
MSGFLPWWNCAALLLDGEDEIDLDIDVRAATAGEAEDAARGEWADHGYNPEAVKVRQIDDSPRS